MKNSPLRSLLVSTVITLPLGVQADSFTLLKGAWNCKEEGVQSRLEFQSPQRLLYNGVAAAYEINGNILGVEEENGIAVYQLSLQGGTLTILSLDGSVTECTRPLPPQASSHEKKAPKQSKSHTQSDASGWPPPYVRPSGNVSWESSSPQHLLYKFAGRWDHYSGSTLVNLYLKPDGTYEDSSETSYSGQFHDSGGYQTGAWGAVGGNRGEGRWTASGTLRKGIITLIAPDGSRRSIRYNVHCSNGECYGSEYFFNGKLYGVKYIYR